MLKKTVFLVAPTNPDPPPNYFGPPYGLSLIGAQLLADKRKVKAYDFDMEPLPLMLSSMEKAIGKEKPCYVAIGIQSCTRGSVYKLVKLIKRIDSSITVILGGPFATLKYELLLRNFPVDYVVIGDGEKTLPELLNCLDSGSDINKIKGIACLSKGRLCKTPEREQVVDLDRLPYPAFHLFAGFDRKINACRKENGALPNFILGKRCTTLKDALLLLSSRGCIYNCVFCPMSKVFKNKVRFHTPGYFAGMVEYFYKKYGIRDYVFGDNTFTLVRSRVMKICDEIIRRKLKIRWSCMTRTDYVDAPLLRKMAKAGCFEISYGVESGSPRIQKLMRKNLDLDRTRLAFNMTRKAGIRSILMLMVGNLGEDESSMMETLKFVKSIDPDLVLIKIVKVYPGTEMHDIFEKKGLLKSNYYLTDEFNPPVFTLQHTEASINKLAGMLNTRTTAIRVGGKCNNKCRLCRPENDRVRKSLADIKKELVLASVRGEQVALCGGEPFLRSDIFDILEYAASLQIHHLYVYSNARIFVYGSLAERLNKTCVRKLIVPIFGIASAHDQVARVDGAFAQAVKGIINIRKSAPNIDIEARVPITSSNYRLLPEVAALLRGLGICRTGFIFVRGSLRLMSIDGEHSPQLRRLLPYVRKAAVIMRSSGGKVYLEGFPLCATGDLQDHCDEYSRPFDETIDISSRIINNRRDRLKHKIKFPVCVRCKKADQCEGVWKEYASRYGSSEFKPCR